MRCIPLKLNIIFAPRRVKHQAIVNPYEEAGELMFRSAIRSVLAAASLLILVGCGGGSAPSTEPVKSGTPASSGPAAPGPVADVKPSGKKTIAVIPKSTAHEFWRQVGEGAQEAVKGHDYDIVFKAGDPGDQPEAQLTLVDQMLAQKVSAIVLAPVHAKFLVQAVDKCFEAKIPLVIIDSGVDAEFTRYTAYVATDNKDGGAQCARALAEAIGKKGDVLLFRYMPGSASTGEREEGFVETLKKEFPGVKIVQEKYAGGTREDAIKSANELLAANPNFQGVFACNESSAIGMLTALREKGLAGKVKFVGFDTAKVLLEAVDNGEIVALAAQSPRLIGSEGVAQALNALENKKVIASIVIPATMKDKSTLKLEKELIEQAEKDKNREAELKKMAEEQEKKNAEAIKQFEAAQAASKAELARQETDEKKRDAELKKLIEANDAANAAKIKEIEDAQKNYKDEVARRQEQDAKREADLKKMKEEFDRKTEEQRKKIEAEEKTHKK